MTSPRIQDILARMHDPSLQLIEPGLERVSRLLSLMGDPQKKLPPVVHVAGTNGKGSTLAYLFSILTTAGYKVHRYTSPHLVRFNERIVLAGEPIHDDYLADVLERTRHYMDRQPVTNFESTTAAAFLAFSEQPADVLLLEVGMGGRLDATNVVEHPMLTAITPVSRDHSNFLGNTISEIAFEKAGILKPSVPCVLGRHSQEASAVIINHADRVGAPLYRMGRAWQVHPEAGGVMYTSPERNLRLRPSLEGRFQADNAGVAVACVDKLQGFMLSDSHISHGVATAHWPGRLQRLSEGKLVRMTKGVHEVWLDGGHNPQGGEMLAEWIRERNAGKVHFICGMLKQKESDAYLRFLEPHAASMYTVTIPGEIQSQPAEQLEMAARSVGIAAVSMPSVEKALQSIISHAKKPALICISGSLSLVGHVLSTY